MHLKMDSWHSDWLVEDNTNREPLTPTDSTQFNAKLYSLDYSVDSPNFSRDDSVESGGEEITDKSDTNILKPTFKSVLQAKKRLQAFSAAKQLKRTGSKEEKAEDGDKGDKTSPKKPRKGEYPGDKAKAVIQEIEEIKRSEAKEAREEREKQEALIANALRTIAMNKTSRSRSLSPDREKRFKRREIKSRNYRRTDSYSRKSPSPDNHNRRSDRRSPSRRAVYPKNWTQYKQLNLTVVKDEELKLKLFPKQKYSQHELVSRFINFSSPSPLIESFKCFSLEEKHENIPVSFMRVTRSRPPLTYSVNVKKNKESFITRKQLFQVISRDRRNAIENLINTPSRYQPNNKVLHSRQWYSKSWKKTSDAECKVIENSVGLSFLQNYSDEEEEIESEEILICSSTKEIHVKKPVRPDTIIHTKNNDVREFSHSAKEIVVVSSPQAEKDISIHSNAAVEQIAEQVEEREKREEKSEETKRLQQNELKQTRKAIRELEEELERRKALKTEEEAKERKKLKKKRKKKVKKKQESSDNEEEKDSPRKKKKRKNKSKKKKYVEEESSSSEDDKRKKKKTRKTEKHKKDKSKKKKEKSKKEETSVKEHKVKKKDEDTEESNLKEENKRKRRKSNNDDHPYPEDNNKPTDLEAPEKKNKKKLNKKQENLDNEKESLKNAEDKKQHNENEESIIEPIENSVKKKRKRDRWGSIEQENVIEETFQLYEFETTDRRGISKSKDYEKTDHKSDPKQSTSKVDRNRSTSREKSNKIEKDLKRLNENHASKNKDQESIISERESRNAKEKFHKPEKSTKEKDIFEEVKFNEFEFIEKSSEKTEDSLIKKHTEKGKQKVDLERNKKYSEKSEKSEKRETDGKSNKNRRNSDMFEKSERNSDIFERSERNSDIFEKSDNQIERNLLKDRCQKEKPEKHQKENKYMEEHPQKDKIIIKQEPDWEILRKKRKRHRNSDSKEASKDLIVNLDLPEDLEDFPLEKEIFNSREKDRITDKRSRDEYRRETGTPDTDDYRENWEKDIFPIWESEDEAPPKPREKLNNSWESDEEIFERGQCVVESSRSFKDTFDLEIPLNIKPFKRREVIDPDTELQLLKREGQTLSEERRRLEIEKLRVKELELKVIREVENKVKDQYKPKAVREVEPKTKEDYKSKVVRDLGSKLKEDLCKSSVVEENKVKEDQHKSKIVRELQSKVMEDQLKPNLREVEGTARKDEITLRETESVEKEDQHTPPLVETGTNEKLSRSLDQEKADLKKGRWDRKVAEPRISTPKVGVIAVTKIKKEIPDEEDSLTNVSSSTSLNNNSAVLENEYEEFMKAVSSSSSRKKKKVKSRGEISSIESSSFESSDSDSSSKILQANKKPISDKELGGQRFVFKNIITNLDELIPVPLDSHSKHSIMILPKDIPLIPMPLPQTEVKPVPVPSPTIDVDKIPKPLFSLGISANLTLDVSSKLAMPGADSPSSKSLEFINPPLATPGSTDSPKIKKLEEIAPLKKPDSIINFASPLTDVSLDSVLFEEKPREKDDTRLNDKPFVFTSMVLPSKRTLLTNSNLNLGDSEDEEVNAAKSMKKLEEIIKENLTDSAKVTEKREKVEVQVEKTNEIESSKCMTDVGIEKRDKARSRSPASNRNDSRKRSSERVVRRDVSPKRTSSLRRISSPRRRIRESSPKRRGFSPRRHQSPRRRTPPRRRNSPVKRKYSPRRSISPRNRRRSSISPPRKLSPRRSISPKRQASLPKKMQSRSPEKPKSTLVVPYKSTEKPIIESNKRKSPLTITSPLEGLKRSVADSTISDDLLPQPSVNLEEYAESPVSRFYNRSVKPIDSPKRVPLDIRINQVLGLAKDEPKPITTTYSNYSYEHSQYHQQFNQMQEQKSNVAPVQKIKVPMKQTKGKFVQVGNMVQIVPTEDIPIVEPSKIPVPPLPSAPPHEKPVTAHKKKKKSQIVQVGNMLQIVPTDMLPEVPLPPEPKPPEPKLLEPKVEFIESIPELSAVVQEKQSAETSMRLKVAERRAERDKRRQERERRRKEKEKRRKEKEKQRQIKLKQRTENMIKKALQLEVEGGAEEEEEPPGLNETPTQWPPLPVIVSSVSKEVGKSILIKGGQSKSNSLRSDKVKIVQFADGVRPGEGTSPSGGEELSSPPPASRKLPKEKRYKKTKLFKKNPKKKVKVKVIKKRPETEESDEEDNLPPPSPPPGSPPPNLFPPRIKTHTINNVHTYIPNVVPIQASHNQQLYRPQLNIVMHPPHPPHHHGPPPPPHHHGPPLPPHHGPPPPHHGPSHHGPPPPPHHHHHGPPHFHHGPPPPPPGPHHHHGLPGHHHHGPPPYHH